jgi:hypothetical protein
LDCWQEEAVGVRIVHQGTQWDNDGIEMRTEKYDRLSNSWDRVLENLIVAQLVKKFPPFTEPEGSLPCEISGSHGGKYEDDTFLGYSTV